MRKQRGIVVPRIARISRRRGIHGIRIEPSFRIDDGDQTGTTAQWSAHRYDTAIQTEIGAATKRAIRLVRGASAPAR